MPHCSLPESAFINKDSKQKPLELRGVSANRIYQAYIEIYMWLQVMTVDMVITIRLE